ncbi:ACT domain-containing protein [Candidatus Omnitrophota bacterium]
MTNAVLGKQLIISVNNKVGTLAEVSQVISSSGINLIAVCAYAVDNKGVIMFVSEDNKTAKKLLKAKDYDVREEEIVLLTVDNKPGSFQAVTQRVAAAGIDLTLIYGSVEQKGKTSRIALISEDNRAVLTAIKTM